MRKKRPITIGLFMLINVFLQAQINPANPRRDWMVGHYIGILKDSIPNVTIICSMNVYYATDSTIFVPMGGLTAVVCTDSTLGNDRFCSNWPFNWSTYGRIRADSSVIFCNFSMGGCDCSYMGNFCDPGHHMVFHGKKVSNTITGINEAELEPKNVAVYPNPVTEHHFNILTLIEPDAFYLYDILGKSYTVQATKTDKGFKIELPINLQEGIYFLSVKKGERTVSKKVMVKTEN